MFFQRIKDISIKKIVKKKWTEMKHLTSNDLIQKVGIILDESYFHEKEDLIRDLVKQGIKKENIRILVFKNHIKKNESFDYPVYSYKDFKWSGSFDSETLRTFLSQYYDLLINYYEMDKAVLHLTTQLSKCGFKVGFASVDKKVNDLIIHTSAENHSEFTSEMFKYLKILNKI